MRALVLSLLVLLAGCAPEVDTIATGDGPILVEVLVPSGEDENGRTRFELEPRELERLEDVRELRGRWLRMRRGGTLVTRVRDDGASIERWLTGDGDPDPRFVVVDGVLVPRDYPTLAMSTAYYHLDQTFAQLEESVGLSGDELASEYGRIDVLFEPRSRTERDDGEVVTAEEANAAFAPPRSGRRALFVLQQRSDREELPLSMDPRVLAHEVGHAVFHVLLGEGDVACEEVPVAQRESDPLFPGRLDLQESALGLNEGFADLLAFTLTGETNPLEAWELEERDITAGDDVALPGSIYAVGSAFARAAYRSFVELGGDPSDIESRRALMRTLAAGLEGLREQLAAQPLPPPSELEVACSMSDTKAMAEPIVRALLAAMPDPEPREMLRGHLPRTLHLAGYEVSL